MSSKTFSILGAAFSFLIYYCLFYVLLAAVIFALVQSDVSFDMSSVYRAVPAIAAGFTASRIVDKTLERPVGWRLFCLAFLCAVLAAFVEAVLFLFQYSEFRRVVGGRADELLAGVIIGGIVLSIFKFFIIWLVLWLGGILQYRRLLKTMPEGLFDGIDGLEGHRVKRLKKKIEPDF